MEPLVADAAADAEPPPTFHQWHDRGHAMWWGLISPTQRQPRGPQGQHATGQPGLGWPPTFHQWHDRGHAMWWGLISPTQRQPRGPQGQHATGQPGLGWPSVTSNSVTSCQTWQQPVCLQVINYLSLQVRKIVMFDWNLKACTKSVPYHLHVNWAFW